ncbi:MAG TPA: flagella basal body P-ring formation protein FlgA [Phycisphaerales bacterium]|nr:flagella basal body P-ring formation protein FlgA [Phycisphaerales bacterium]HBR20693.1 flagella basal body P-ring formation protein FlgA [Phycisphaerales bacterium]
MKKTRINTGFFRHGLTRINTVKNVTSLCPLCSLWLIVFMAGTALAVDGGLQVYLPRDVKIDSPTPTLGQIAILSGDEAMVQAASSIAMGQLALVNQRLIIDRPTILSRLASSGVSASRVKFAGAEKVAVSLKNTIISSEKIIQTATDCMKAAAGENKISKWTLTRPPQDLLLGELKANITLKASQSLVQPNVVRVLVEVFADDKLAGKQFVDFRVKYSASRIVAAADIARDSIITRENTTVQNVEADSRQIGEQTAFFGMTARGDIKQGTAIADNMLYNPKPQTVVKRNQNVVIKIESSAVMITATGKAMDDGMAGEIIKVQNNDSKRIIMAKVNADGSVEPVF